MGVFGQGRPSMLTDDRARRIVELAAHGHYNTTIARAVGVSQRSYQRWLQLGEEAAERLETGQPIEPEHERYWQLWQQVRAAEATVVDNALTAIHHAYAADPVKGWGAAAWILERKYPAEFGRRTEVAVGPTSRLMEVLAASVLVGEETEEDTTAVNGHAAQLPAPGHGRPQGPGDAGSER